MIKTITLQHKIKLYALIIELTSHSMEKIKTLQEKLKTYAPLVELTIESMKNKKKIKNYLIQSTHAIIKMKLTCVLYPLDNIKATKKRLTYPK